MKKKNSTKYETVIPELNDADTERLAEDIPALDKKALSRITRSCTAKMGAAESAGMGFAGGDTVSGTEKYTKPRLIKYLSAAAACFVAVAGIAGIIIVGRNMKNNNIKDTDSVITETVPDTTSGKSQSADEGKTEASVLPTENENPTETEIYAEKDTTTASVTTAVTVSAASAPKTDTAATSTTKADSELTVTIANTKTTTTANDKTTTAANTTTTVNTTVPIIKLELSEKQIYEATEGTWQTECCITDSPYYLVMDGKGGITLYGANGAAIESGKLTVLRDAGGDVRWAISFTCNGKTYAYEFNPYGTELIPDNGGNEGYMKISDKVLGDPVSARYYDVKTLGVWNVNGENAPMYLIMDGNGKYSLYDRKLGFIQSGYLITTELGVEGFDCYNSYSADMPDGMGLEPFVFTFSSNGVIKSGDRTYTRIGFHTDFFTRYSPTGKYIYEGDRSILLDFSNINGIFTVSMTVENKDCYVSECVAMHGDDIEVTAFGESGIIRYRVTFNRNWDDEITGCTVTVLNSADSNLPTGTVLEFNNR